MPLSQHLDSLSRCQADAGGFLQAISTGRMGMFSSFEQLLFAAAVQANSKEDYEEPKPSGSWSLLLPWGTWQLSMLFRGSLLHSSDVHTAEGRLLRHTCLAVLRISAKLPHKS